MTKNFFRKGLSIGIIILLIGTCYISICNANIFDVSNFGTNNKSLNKNNNDISMQLSKDSNKNWTWMFYDDADFWRAYDPLTDFAEEVCSGENLDVIVLQDKEFGPAKMWYIDENHNKELLQNLGEINMGAYQTLYNFIDYSKENYPADRYFISFYNHGGGWLGACIDDTNNDMLSMDEIQRGLTDAGGADIICFTAPCLMGALESMYELRDCVDIYVGSEEGSGYGHWFGTITGICDILNNNPDLTNVEIGEQIIHLIEENTPWPDSITMSAVRTDKMEELANSIDKVAHNLVDNYDECYKKLWSIYYDIQYFSNGGILDVYDFAEKYSSVENNTDILQNLTSVMNCIQEAVVAECHGSKYLGAHGLTIYFPQRKSKYNTLYNNPKYGLDFTQNTYWDEFINKYMKPRYRTTISSPWLRFFEGFPILQKILCFIL